MKKIKHLFSVLLIMLLYFLSPYAIAQSFTQVSVVSQGSINYASTILPSPSPLPSATASPTSTPTPTPSPLATPTHTPTPQPTATPNSNSLNLAPIFQNGIANCPWGDAKDHNGDVYGIKNNHDGTYNYAAVVGSIDYSNLSPNANPSIKVNPSTEEIDGTWVAVHPGDHIVISVWIKTGSYSSDQGAEIGVDLYDTSFSEVVDGLPSGGGWDGYQNQFSGTPQHSSSWTSSTGTCTCSNVQYVPWSSGWTKQTYDFIVPSYVYTMGGMGGPAHSISPQQIGFAEVWISERPDNADAPYVWFADAELYVNP